MKTPEEHPTLRPLLAGDLEAYGAAMPHVLAPEQRFDIAQSTAEAVLAASREGSSAVDLAALGDAVGLDTLAQLWCEAPTDSLPGALWTLYLLRAWCRRSPEQVAQLYRSGRVIAEVDDVVAGMAETAGAGEVISFADSVITGMRFGEIPVAWERAAAFFRVIAAGRDFLSTVETDESEKERSARHRTCADALSRAAENWRKEKH